MPKLRREVIRNWLERHNWSVGRLAEECSKLGEDTFPEGTMRNVVNGIDPMRPGRIRVICRVTAKYGDGIAYGELVQGNAGQDNGGGVGITRVRLMGNESYRTSPVVGYMRSAKINGSEFEAWETKIRTYAAEQGYNLVVVLREEGVSGVAASRPVFDQLIQALAAGEYVGVIIPGPNHLAADNTAAKRATSRIVKTGAWIHCLEMI